MKRGGADKLKEGGLEHGGGDGEEQEMVLASLKTMKWLVKL